MMDELVRILQDGNHSLVVAGDGIRTFDGRGISNLYSLLTEHPDWLRGASVADKVVGKGAAALLILGGVRELFAGVISTPMLASLPSILLKSVLLALFAGLAAARFRNVTVWILVSVVLAYQIVGTLGEWALKGDFYLAVQDFRIGVPGMLLQVFGGWACINKLLKN